MGVFGIIDKVIISVVVIAVLGTITIIAYAVITALLEENEHTKRIKEDEKLRRKRLEKIPIKKENVLIVAMEKVILSDMTVYECSHPDVWDNHVIESGIIGCQSFDTEITAYVAEKIRRNERLSQKNENIEII